MLKEIFYFLFYPGMLFAGVVGGLLSWFDRKLTAMVQFRKGPPPLQPFYDFFKLLLVKETILPARGSVMFFLLAPVLALFGATIACVLVLMPVTGLNSGFSGDIIVIFYLLNIPSLAYIFGAMASGNPLASIGASREIKLIISYELTFLLVLAGVIMKAGMNISVHEVLAAQSGGAFIGSIPGILLFIVSIMCVQAKLGLVPFDIAEAETEINHGAFIEYSGVVLLLTLIRNTNPRVKIRQAMRFFFVWMNLLVIIAIVLIFYGY
jgi:NADH-quinone oxidoreductase subunit H